MKDVIKFAFYKVQKGDFWGNLTAGYTKLFNWNSPCYCHVEIGIPINGEYKWYSSASRNLDGSNGTRWISEKELLKHPERWDVFEVLNIISVYKMIDICEIEKNKPYDWYGIIGFITPFGQINSKQKWYCSEICNYVYTGIWQKRISPEGLFLKIKKYILK